MFGVGIDWAVSQSVLRSILIEARDQGELGFLVTADQIEGTGTEVRAAMGYLAAAMDTKSKTARTMELGQLLDGAFQVLTGMVMAFFSSKAPETDRRVSYEGAQVWRALHMTPGDFDVMHGLEDTNEISIWRPVGTSLDFLVRSEKMPIVHEKLKSNNIRHIVLEKDVESRIKETSQSSNAWEEKKGLRLAVINTYPTFDSIMLYLASLEAQYPGLCYVRSIGNSIEGRPVKLIRVSNGKPDNEVLVIIAGSHSQEWASITSSLFVLDYLVKDFHLQLAHIINKDWFIIPVVNPDGYEYAFKVDRLWKKNRRKFPDSCIGVNLNRNFDRFWVPTTNRCQEDYGGDRAGSEPETKAVTQLTQILMQIQKEYGMNMAFVDILSYGQWIGYPYAGKSTPIKNKDVLDNIASGMAKAIYSSTNQKYTYGSFYEIAKEIAPGTHVDWAYSIGVPRVFAISTRDLGRTGFLLPVGEIEGAGRDVLAAILYLSKQKY